MAPKKTRLQIVSRRAVPIAKKAAGARQDSSGRPLVSGRWLMQAVAISFAGAAFCCWAAFCLLFWQGSWQLLYHPTAPVTKTPASVGIAFEPVQFAVSDTGLPQLRGWWIPAESVAPLGRFTVLYLHGEKGNLSDSVDALARLHSIGVNILGFDYRGYGQSQFVRPSEAHWREDANWALQYLSETRHVNPATIVLAGDGLGADLALEVAAGHPELAGVILQSPVEVPVDAIFKDARARLVPAHLLVRDRFDLNKAAAALRVPLLWFDWNDPRNLKRSETEPTVYREATSRKTIVWLNPQANSDRDFVDALKRFLDGLAAD